MVRLPIVRVNEVYSAHQGEGPRLGTPSVFYRLHHCPVQCDWCDTAFTWDGSEDGAAIDVAGALDTIERVAHAARARHVVVTGGEPLVTKALPELLVGLVDRAFSVEVETAAIRPPDRRYRAEPDWFGYQGVSFNLSPKMPSARPKIAPDPAILDEWLALPLPTLLKIVVADEADWAAMEALLDVLSPKARDRLWVMPCATRRDALARAQAWLLERAAGTGYHVTTRMHITAFGDRRRT